MFRLTLHRYGNTRSFRLISSRTEEIIFSIDIYIHGRA